MSFARTFAVIALLTMAASPALAQSGGRIGNLNDPVQTVPDLLTGNQSFAYLVFPAEQVSCPDGGCALQNVFMYLDFTPEQVPQLITVSGGFISAESDGDGGWIPGDDICVSPPMQIEILEPGPQVIVIPVADICGCVPVDQPYFLNVNFEDDANGGIPIDNEPQAGVVYWDLGDGYTDMIDVIVDKTSDGKVIIWGDILCCIVVGNEAQSWDNVKSLFR